MRNDDLSLQIKDRIDDDVSILKDNAETFADCHGLADEQGVAAREDGEQEVRQASEEKIRNCLVCKTPFPSSWAGERVCRRCKSTAAWRSGALG